MSLPGKIGLWHLPSVSCHCFFSSWIAFPCAIGLPKTLYPPFTTTDHSQVPFPFPYDDDSLKTILADICSFTCLLKMLTSLKMCDDDGDYHHYLIAK